MFSLTLLYWVLRTLSVLKTLKVFCISNEDRFYILYCNLCLDVHIEIQKPDKFTWESSLGIKRADNSVLIIDYCGHFTEKCRWKIILENWILNACLCSRFAWHLIDTKIGFSITVTYTTRAVKIIPNLFPTYVVVTRKEFLWM